MSERHQYPNPPPNIKRLHRESKIKLREINRKLILKNGFTAAAKRRLLFVPDDELTMYNGPSPMKKIKKETRSVVIPDPVKAGQQNFNVNSSIPTSQESTNHPCTTNSLHLIDNTTPNSRFWKSSSSQCSSLASEFDQKLVLNSQIPTTTDLPVPTESIMIFSEDSPPKISQGSNRA